MYGKIFKQIFASSIAEDYEVRHIFMDLIVLADSDGVIDMTPESISAVTRVPLTTVNLALTALTKPDQKSRTHEEEGRRLIPIDPHRDWGWKIVNYEKYREIRDETERKAYMRRYMQQYRKKDKETAVNSVNSCKPPLAKGDPSPSSSLSEEGNCKGGETPDGGGPTWEEFWKYIQQLCPSVDQNFAKDKWLKEESAVPPWGKVGNWWKYAERVIGWWASNGQAKTQAKKPKSPNI